MTVIVDRNAEYDPLVYENTWGNLGAIFGMFMLFYFVQAFHWWANFAVGIHASEVSTIYNLCIFATAVIIIGFMLWTGSFVNEKVITHDYYEEKISEWRIILQEEQNKKISKEAAARKKSLDEVEAAFGLEAAKRKLSNGYEVADAKVDFGVAPGIAMRGHGSVFGGPLPAEGTMSRKEAAESVKQARIGGFKELLAGFTGFQAGMQVQKLDELWALMDTSNDGVH